MYGTVLGTIGFYKGYKKSDESKIYNLDRKTSDKIKDGFSYTIRTNLI
jgi:hypothetical protein